MRLTDAAFEGAVERYGDTVFRLAYSYLKNRADAEDVMQETLLKLYLERKPFRSPEHERYWVVRVAVNESKKLLRFTLDCGEGTPRQILSGIAMWYKPEELVGKTLVAIVNLPPRKMMGLESNGMLISAVHTEKGEEQLNLLMIDDKIPAGAKMC